MKNSYHRPMRSCTLIFSILLFLLFSCQNNSIIEDKIYSEFDVEFNKNVKNIDDLSFVKSAKLVFLENDRLIGNIKKLYIHDNKIYIWDNVADKIFVFDTSGKYCFSLSGKGMGPNEYISITSFCYSKTDNNIFILDTKKRKIFCFSGQDGKFLYKEDIEHVPISIESDLEKLYFYNPFTFNYSNSDLKYSLITTNKKSNILNKEFYVDDQFGKLVHNPSFQDGFGTGVDLLLINRYDLNIYNLTKNEKYKLIFNQNSKERLDYLNFCIKKSNLKSFDVSEFVSSISKVVNTDSTIYLNYCVNNQFNFAFINKNNLELILHGKSYTVLTDELLERGIPIFELPSFAFDNSFISVINPERIISIRPILNKFKDKIDDYPNIQRLKNGDNPILLIYKL
jgi:hypothetical protein